MTTDNYLLVAAIDFGTTYSGYAFSTIHDFKREPTKMSLAQWIAGSGSMISQKASTCVLFKPDRTFHSFGYEAEDAYLELALDNKQTDWYLFRRFKMHLYNSRLERGVHLKDFSGEKKMPAIYVISATIGYLKSHLTQRCMGQGVEVEDSDIRWVLTIPAIWNDSAKQMMREAAEMAGIKQDQLILSLEPEAASVFCKNVPLGQLRDGDQGSFQTGTKYMVIDAGGGTIDITVHEVQKEGHLREIVVANGGDWGGTRVDDAFESLLQNILGEQAFSRFKSEHLYDLMDLVRSFEVKKKLIKENQTERVTFSIPASLLSTYNNLYPEQSIADSIAKNKEFVSHVEFRRDKLRLSQPKAIALFDQSIARITCHVRALLCRPKVRDISAILMVGGYSECPLLVEAIRHIACGVRVVVPNEAGLAVLKGAVIIGHSPSTISERICKYTYGVEAHLPFIEGKHKKDYRVLGDGGKDLCKLAFDSFVKKGTSVKIDEHSSAKKYVPLTASQKIMNFSIYASTDGDPAHVNEISCQKIGKIKIELPDTAKGLERRVCVTMFFGGTEIQIKAVDEDTGRYVRAACDFLG